MGSFDLASFMTNTAVLAAILILAAMGGLTSERSGVMNIGLEGKMLGASCVVAIIAAKTGNAWIGLGAGILTAVALSMLHGLLTQAYRLDHIISGMAINLIAVGGTKFMYGKLADSSARSGFPSLPANFYEAVAITVAVSLAIYIARFKGGLRLLAVGNDPDKSRQVGLNPVSIRYTSLVATGVFCGLSGALIVTNAGGFTDNMTAGKGFIALAALILGGWRPIPVLIACITFGLIDAAQLQFQGVAKIPSEAWNAMPYLITLVAIAVMNSRNRAPAGLGRA